MTNANPPTLLTFDLDQRLPGGFRFPARMTAMGLPGGGVALVSPIPVDDAMAGAIAALGEVRYLIAPNLLHHLYLGDAIARFPGATVLAPEGLARKRPDLRVDATLGAALPGELGSAVDAIAIEGVPAFSEFAFYHRPSRTLVVTDLVFHVERPRGFVANVVLALVGCHGRLGQSRVWRLAAKDRDALAASAARLLELPFESLVMAHGTIVTVDARERLRAALPHAPLRALPAR